MNSTEPQVEFSRDETRSEDQDCFFVDNERECPSIEPSPQEYETPPITTRFRDIIGHGSAKLRIDEMLLPLALPPSLAESLLTGELFKTCFFDLLEFYLHKNQYLNQ